jgi:hypothetical protein
MSPFVNQYAILYQEYMMTAAMLLDSIGLYFIIRLRIGNISLNDTAESQADADSILPGFRTLAKSQLCLTLLLL